MFDAVVAGQTWHWIDPVAGASKAAAILRPGGRLAVFWNVGDPPPEIADGFAAVYRSVDTGLPFTPWVSSAREGYRRILDPAIAGMRGTGAFAEPERSSFDWQLTITRGAWLDQVPTGGGFGLIPPRAQQALLGGMSRVIDAAGGSFRMSYTTLAIMATRGS
jgi:SAM-dependent methyltransferase